LNVIRDQVVDYAITLREFTTSCCLPRRSSRRASVTLACALLALLAPSGCRRGARESVPPGDSPALRRLHANLRLVPREAGIVLALDLERLRGTSAWNELAAGPLRDAALLLDGLAQGIGIDPITQVREVLLAVPGERQADDRFIAIMRIDRSAEARAAKWLAQRPDGPTAAFFQPPDGVVIAKGAWAGQARALAGTAPPAASAAAEPELRRLCERAAADHAIWLAAIVPPSVRRAFFERARFPDLASLARVRAAIDIDRELHAEVVAELSNEPDARSLALRLGDYLQAAKRHPDVLAQGLAPYLEALRLAARGPNLHATLDLPASQSGDLGSRLADVLYQAWRAE
jgi:hypothetical protein